MSKTGRSARKGKRALPAGLVLVFLFLGMMAPPPASGCGMSADSAASESVAPTDCCTDGSCPRMTVAPSRPAAILTAPPALAYPLAAAAIVKLSPAAVAPLVHFPSRLHRDGLLGPPLRI